MKETCGLRINGNIIGMQPVHSGKIPNDFIASVQPKCLNYCLNEDIESHNVSIPTGFSQLSSVSFQEDEPHDLNLDPTPSNNTRKNVYSFLIASFKELCSVFESNTDNDELIQIRSYLQDKASTKKKEIFQSSKTYGTKTMNESVPVGTYISSNINASKKRKTHGTKYFRN